MKDERDTQLEISGAFIKIQLSVCEVKQRCFIILDTFESPVIMLLCAFVTCLIKCITLKCLWGFHVFYKTKPENQGCMMSLAGDTRTLWTRSV